jgi:hypothetical protein
MPAGRSGVIGHWNPKNGRQRVVQDRDSVKHLEIFMNGRWIHDDKCSGFTNKQCNKIKH